MDKIKLDPYLTLYQKLVQSESNKGFEIRPEFLKYIEENIDKILQALHLKNVFNDTVPLVKATE